MKDLVDIALLFHGKEYVYGGNYFPTGLDCSGFICEVLRSCGVIGQVDLTAQSIYDVLKVKWGYEAMKKKGRGTFLFFGKSADKITHIGLQISDLLMIEAGGGDSSTMDIKTSQKQNAYVRIRPMAWRSDLVATIKKEVLI